MDFEKEMILQIFWWKNFHLCFYIFRHMAQLSLPMMSTTGVSRPSRGASAAYLGELLGIATVTT